MIQGVRRDEARERLLDELAANATPAAVTHLLDGWVVRISPELPFRRANSVLTSLGEPADVSDAIAVAESVYERLGARAAFQVSSASQPADLDTALAARGYSKEAPVAVLTARVEEVTRRSVRRSPPPGGTVTEAQTGVSDEWIGSYAAIHATDPATRKRVSAYGRMLASVGGVVITASARRDRNVVALGFGVVERGWVGVFGMGTAPQMRRTGASSEVLRTIMETAADLGAPDCYLQVERDNAAARAMYAGVGFQRSHVYHYRRAPRASSRFPLPPKERR